MPALLKTLMESIEKIRWWTPDNHFKYPHLFGVESRLIDSFIIKYKSILKRIAFDIPVGQGRPGDTSNDASLDKIWKYSTSYKVDALADFGISLWLIECKTIGNPEAIGQLISYNTLFRRTYSFAQTLSLVLLCADHHPDLDTVAHSSNIQIEHLDIVVRPISDTNTQ